MALSGSKTTAFCSRNGANRFYLQWSWSATQSVTANTSTVKVLLYLGSYGNGYGMNASATKSGTITINGNTKNFTTAGISLSSGGKVKLAEHSVTITHANDGTKSFAINASYNPSVTISGTSQGNVSMGSTTYTLNTIARASTISCTGKWTFPGNHTISISRKNSAFTHDVRVYVGGTLIKSWSKTASTSFSTSFTTAENTTIAGKLGTGSATPSVATEIQVDTYSGSTKIGSTASVKGTCTATTRSTTTFTNNWNIGATISGKITENNSAFNHTVQLLKSDGTEIVKITNNNNTINWSYNTGNIASTLYALTPNSNSYTGLIRIRTYFNSVQIGSHAQSNITFKVANSNPTFAPTLSYSDINTTTSGITGSNRYIVQNKSSLRVVCTGNATANNSATMKTIQCTVAGVTKSATWSSSATSYTFDFGTINASSNQSAVVQAVDSRGNKTSKTITITCLPYTAPKLTAKVERANKFSTSVNVVFSGTYSVVNVGGTYKNSITIARSYIAIDNGEEDSTPIKYTLGYSNGTYWNTVTDGIYTIAETSIASVRILITDAFGGTATTTISVPTGLPIMFVDAEKGNISFNALPDMTKEANMKVGMQIDTAKNQYWTQGSGSAALNVAGNYGINMNNSDLVGLGGLFFCDVCEAANHNEGIFFVNSGSMSTAPSGNGFSRMYIRDGQIWVSTGNTGSGITNMVCVGNSTMMTSLWEGGYYMTAGHTVTPSKSLSNCPTGWVLAWSDFDSSTSTKNNYDWVFQLIPKQTATYGLGTIMQSLPVGLSDAGAGTWACKKLTITNTTITGHDLNAKNTSVQNDVVLRYVFMV